MIFQKKGTLQTRLILYFMLIISILGFTVLFVFINLNRDVQYFQKNFEYNYNIELISIKITELNELINNFIYGLVVNDYINRYNYEYLQLLKIVDQLQMSTPVESDIYFMLSDLRNYLYSYNENVVGITEQKTGTGISVNTEKALSDLNMKKNYIIDEVNRILYMNLSQSYPVYREITERIKTIRLFTIIMMILVVIFMYFLSLRFAKTISKPIHILALEMNKFSHDTSIPAPLLRTTDKDISAIVDSYRKMTERVKALIQEIQEKADLEMRLQEKEIQNLKMSELLKQSEMKFLRSQVNPHFLFNTLNVISSLAAMENATESVAVIRRLTNMLRCSLDKTSGLVPLESELELIRNYMYIQEVRFGGRISAAFNINENIVHSKIPRMVLQPIVENSVIHGLEPKKGNGQVVISAQQSKNSLILSVRDNGIGFAPEKLNSVNKGCTPDGCIGIENVMKRLYYHYGKDVMTVSSSNEWGTETVIEIPIDTAGGIPSE